MCGLFGAMSRWLDAGDVSKFRDLMIIHVLRGAAGSGMIALPEDAKKEIKYFRSIDNGGRLAHSSTFEDMVEERPTGLLGHTRSPTTGSRKNDVHPFVHKHIMGMHNGTFETVAGEKIPKGVCDSNFFFQRVAEDGFQNVIQKSTGSYSLVWVDQTQGTVNFFRNTAKPLFFACDKDLPLSWFWGSEPRFLETVLTRTNDTTVGIGAGSLQTFLVPPFQLIQFPIRPKSQGILKPRMVREIRPDYLDKGGSVLQLPFLPQTITDEPGQEFPTSETKFGASMGGETTSVSDAKSSKSSASVTAPSKVHDRNATEGPLRMVDKNHPAVMENEIEMVRVLNRFIPKEELWHRLGQGCDSCGAEGAVAHHQMGNIFWLDHDRWYCKECQSISWVRDYMKEQEGKFTCQ